MSSQEILIVDDERPIRELISAHLGRAGYIVREAEEAHAAQVCVAEHPPALMLVDWVLPDGSGLDFVRALRNEPSTQHIPVIMLTAHADEEYKLKGLDSGADDYITKPFSLRELLARIQAVLRRVAVDSGESPLECKGLVLNRISHRVTAGGGRNVALGPTEYRFLELFMSHAGLVYTRYQLLDRIWGANGDIDARTVDVHIRRLRRALEEFGCDQLVQTVRGVGYTFSAKNLSGL